MGIPRMAPRVIPFLLAAMFWTASLAEAQTITCLYTEPLLKVVYDLKKRTIKVYKGVEKRPRIAKGSVKSLGTKSFQIVSKALGVKQTLMHDNKGTDGASDKIYPYSSTWTQKDRPLPVFGGCDKD